MSNDANKLKNRQEIRKYLVFAGMFLLFTSCMWWIFAPSAKDRQEKEKNAGFNTELPDPRGAGIEADKITAYEQADMKRRQEEKMRTLEDFSAMADGHKADEPGYPVVEIESAPEYPNGGTSGRNSGSYRRSSSFSPSHSAYNDINTTLGSFYETPKEDPEKEALKAEVEQLRQAAAVQQPAQMTYGEQVALLEKSYELAAKYTSGGGGVLALYYCIPLFSFSIPLITNGYTKRQLHSLFFGKLFRTNEKRIWGWRNKSCYFSPHISCYSCFG